MSAAPFALVVAADARNGIGRGGGMPWRLRAETAHFVATTATPLRAGTRNAVIMGRLTWESILQKFRPLADRTNIVVTTRPADGFPGDVLVAPGLAEALALAEARPDAGATFVIGGARLYAEALTHSDCKTVFLTRVEGDFACDTFIPALGAEWHCVQAGERQAEAGIGYRFEVWERGPAA